MLEQLEFWELVDSRRSARLFEDRLVDRQLIEKVLETGTLAPNAHNRQSWRFVVLTKKKNMVHLAEQMNSVYLKALTDEGMPVEEAQERANARLERLTGAPVVVILLVETAEIDHYTDLNRNEGEYLMAVQSAALAGGHMLLAAQALGLSGVWMCAPLFAPEQVRKSLSLPETWQAQGLLLLGYPAERPALRPRKPLEDVSVWR